MYFTIFPSVSIVESEQVIVSWVGDDDDGDELFLWYGWPTKGF